ncbi:hypothetical protein T01_7184 [Trichinella spiralis]|uniref:Transmembrane protein n=1 Tax=Trichinella spiralis TaxID=6334 RepID=A0A0V1BZZ8_TRISP|nr:hypothetical protein T01_7184 [Trichinella spiralis]
MANVIVNPPQEFRSSSSSSVQPYSTVLIVRYGTNGFLGRLRLVIVLLLSIVVVVWVWLLNVVMKKRRKETRTRSAEEIKAYDMMLATFLLLSLLTDCIS